MVYASSLTPIHLSQEIITAKDLASQVDVRLLATVYFKNSVNRYWRSRRDSLYDILPSFVSFFSMIYHFHYLRKATLQVFSHLIWL